MENVHLCENELPVVLVASHSGSNDRKRDLVVKLMQAVKVTMISGRMGDIVAVSQALQEKGAECLFYRILHFPYKCVNIW